MILNVLMDLWNMFLNIFFITNIVSVTHIHGIPVLNPGCF